MNMNDLHLAPPTTPISADPYPAYIFDNPRQQNFSIPWPIMKYILKNPTGKACKKLIKSCKYFFPKYPVFPVEKLKYCKGRWNVDGEKLKLTKSVPKLWFFDALQCWNRNVKPNSFSKVFSKIYKFDFHDLRIINQDLTWETYQILTSSGSFKYLYFTNCSIKYVDGKDVTMDTLLEILQQVENFAFTCKPGSKMFEKDTVMKMANTFSRFKNMRFATFHELNETFDLPSLMNFLMKNETIIVDLLYVGHFQLTYPYKEVLQTCFEQLLANPPKKLPKITIPEFRRVQYREYCKMYYGKK